MQSVLRVLVTVGLAAAVAACDLGNRNDTDRNQNPGLLSRDYDSGTELSDGGSVGTSGVQTTEQNFDHYAMMANHAEVELGRLAQRKAQNAEVKQFATQIVNDHTKAMQELQKISGTTHQFQQGQPQGGHPPTGQGQPGQRRADRQPADMKGNQPHAGMQLDPMHQQTYDRLNRLSGAEFDREFMRVMVENHQQAVSRFQQVADMTTTRSGDRTTGTTGRAADTTNPRVSQWARQTLPTLQRHLERAQQIQSRLDQRQTNQK